MTIRKRQANTIVACIVMPVMIIALGCGTSSSPARPLTPAEYFNKNQQNTVTPFGRIVPGSAVAVDGDDAIRYQTDDGTFHEVPFRRNADGGYHYGTPKAVENATDTKGAEARAPSSS
jgi:hypothetical protein